MIFGLIRVPQKIMVKSTDVSWTPFLVESPFVSIRKGTCKALAKLFNIDLTLFFFPTTSLFLCINKAHIY